MSEEATAAGEQDPAPEPSGDDGSARAGGDAAGNDRPQQPPGGPPHGNSHPSGGDGRPVTRASVRVPTEADMRDLGLRLAAQLRPGDLLVLAGELGAGKTTFVQGLGAGLGVEAPITSPTFVLARVHAVPAGGVPLVHADAYRLGSIAELDDLDLETPAEGAVTVVEWGAGMAEDLAEDRLELRIERRDGEERVVHLAGVGRRWQGALG